MSTITCLCATALANVSNDPCDAVIYGNQIVKIFAQKMTGVTFDGTALNTVTVEADWDTKIAAVNDDKIVTIGNIAGAVRDSVEPIIEEGNDVPYDGIDIIDKPQEFTFDVKYFKEATFAELDQTVCWGKIRIWWLDNKDYLWGGTLAVDNGDGILNANIITSPMSQSGIGTSNKAVGNKVKWNSFCQPVPVANLPFLRNK